MSSPLSDMNKSCTWYVQVMSRMRTPPKHYRRTKHLHVLMSADETRMLDALRAVRQETVAEVIRDLVREAFRDLNRV